MMAASSASLRTTTHLSFLSSSSSTPRPQTQPPRSFLRLKSQPFKSPLHFSSQPLHPRSKPQLKAISSDLDISLLNPHCPSLKSRLASGETLYGIFLLSFSPTLAEIAGLAGYDYVVVDLEHGPGGISEALQCLRVLASTHTPVILRVPEVSAAWAKKALDLGPQGIMFPSIESVNAAEMAVSYCRFPPRGMRGTAHTIVRASAYGLDDAYVSRCEEELLIMCQVFMKLLGLLISTPKSIKSKNSIGQVSQRLKDYLHEQNTYNFVRVSSFKYIWLSNWPSY